MNIVKIIFVLVFFIIFSGQVFAQDYVIGDGDTLQISVWGSPELSLGVIVRPDGKISLPAIGEIKASGLTPIELTEVLEKEMGRVVKTPIVTVIVTGMTNYQIFIFGRGAPPGVQILSRETSLLEFLCTLGSLENADLQNAYLVRNKKTIKKGFYSLFKTGDFKEDIVLIPNDMIFIPDNFDSRIAIVGAINNPTTIPYREGLTVLDIILSAGGFTQFAKENNVIILRKTTNGERVKRSIRVKDLMKGELKENILIFPGDFIIAKESFF